MTQLQDVVIRVYKCASTCKRFINSHAIVCHDKADNITIAQLIESQRQLEDELIQGYPLTADKAFPLVIRALEATESFIEGLRTNRIESLGMITAGGEL